MSDEDEILKKKGAIGLEDELTGFTGGDEILDVFSDDILVAEDDEDDTFTLIDEDY